MMAEAAAGVYNIPSVLSSILLFPHTHVYIYILDEYSHDDDDNYKKMDQ